MRSRDGDRVLAVIRGTAVNQDGRSGGLTVPERPGAGSGHSRGAGRRELEPADVDYVEAHGTGTSLGDPIEVRALGGRLGRRAQRTDDPLLIGSVKTNIGHLESAAGIAGVIKVILVAAARAHSAASAFQAAESRTSPGRIIRWK